MNRWHPSQWKPSDLGYLLLFGITLLVSNNPFFWDTIQLGAKHATWFYDQQFNTLLLPEEMDSGHPPLFGLYLATCWLAFGKSLLVSHLAMLPFLWGILAALQRLHQQWFPDRPAWPLVLWIFADPLIASQSVLISPDIILLCCLLWVLVGWYQDRPKLQALFIIIMGLVSMRGMMTAFALFLFQCIICVSNRQMNIRKFISMLLPYLPGGLLALAFLYWHYQQTGWWGFHSDSPWAPSFARVNGQGVVWNILILGWRMVDHGRIWWWVLAILSIIIIKKDIWRNQAQAGMLLTLCFAIILLPNMLTRAHLLAHRYLLPIFIGMHFWGYAWWCSFAPRLQKKILLLIITGFLTGNLWIYPPSISQGWDATLAHIPWYNMRKDIIDFADQQHIPLSTIGTHFPMVGPIKYRTLEQREDGFGSMDTERIQYVLVSNINNTSDFDSVHDGEKEAWKLIYSDYHWPITVELYQLSSATQ